MFDERLFDDTQPVTLTPHLYPLDLGVRASLTVGKPAPSSSTSLHLPFLVHAALLEDLLSATVVRLKLFVSSEEWVTDVSVDEEENGD